MRSAAKPLLVPSTLCLALLGGICTWSAADLPQSSRASNIPIERRDQSDKLCLVWSDGCVNCSRADAQTSGLRVSQKKCDASNGRKRPMKTARHRCTSTGILQWVRTLTVSLPSTIADMPWRPCEAMTIRSQSFDPAVSMIAR